MIYLIDPTPVTNAKCRSKDICRRLTILPVCPPVLCPPNLCPLF